MSERPAIRTKDQSSPQKGEMGARAIFLAFTLFILSVAIAEQVDAAQIKSIQRGTSAETTGGDAYIFDDETTATALPGAAR